LLSLLGCRKRCAAGFGVDSATEGASGSVLRHYRVLEQIVPVPALFLGCFPTWRSETWFDFMLTNA
jgi:hypothetical protein